MSRINVEELKYYEISLEGMEVKVKYNPKSKMLNEEIKSDLKDFILRVVGRNNFRSLYDMVEHCNYIMKTKIMKSEKLLLELQEIIN